MLARQRRALGRIAERAADQKFGYAVVVTELKNVNGGYGAVTSAIVFFSRASKEAVVFSG